MGSAGGDSIRCPQITHRISERAVKKMGTVTQAELKKRTLAAMEDDLRIPAKNASDFIESLAASVEEAMEAGDKVSLFGLVTLTPVGVPAKPKRKGTDPRSGEERVFDPVPAKVKVRATVGKRVKDALPEPQSKVGKALISETRARQKAAQERREAAEAEAEKEARKAERAAKSGAKKSAKKK